ncbi:MAG: chorismate mutase [Chloroflexi bacterium]|nr:chorismate mutase [Chloroflexota bacterium]
MVACRGIRGATTAKLNTREEIHKAAARLMENLIAKNNLRPDDIAAVLFTTTADIDAAFPSTAVRRMPGWENVPLVDMLATGVPVADPGQPPLCIRVLILWNTECPQQATEWEYQEGAKVLRPDRVG